MQKNHEYTFESRVRFSEVDHTKKMTLPGIINYFQDCSIFQSESLGLGVDYLAERRKAWVLSAWQVEVLRYPEIAEAVSVHTWATNFKGMLGERNFCMKDQAGGRIACANSVWVYMDLEKGGLQGRRRRRSAGTAQGSLLIWDKYPGKLCFRTGWKLRLRLQ